MLNIHGAGGLIVVSMIWCLRCGFAGTAGLIVVRSAPPADVGSVSSSMAFINNAYVATLVFVSGQLIQPSGQDYRYGCLLGLVMMTVAYGILLFYRQLMRADRARSH